MRILIKAIHMPTQNYAFAIANGMQKSMMADAIKHKSRKAPLYEYIRNNSDLSQWRVEILSYFENRSDSLKVLNALVREHSRDPLILNALPKPAFWDDKLDIKENLIDLSKYNNILCDK